MADKTITRLDLTEAVQRAVGLTAAESANLVGQVLQEICDTLAAGEDVKLSAFGAFKVRTKAERVGRNPKTGDEYIIEPHRVVTFTASPNLKAHLNGTTKKRRTEQIRTRLLLADRPGARTHEEV